jgi:ech hydrogenase subunit C
MSSLSKSPWIMHYDASSCNGCDIEVLACLTPLYDVERFGIVNTGNPKHADILLITGSVNEQNKEVIQNIYNQMPDPKVVVAIGICATTGGVFAECYNVMGGAEKIIPVDVYVPGCAARPESIIDGVVKALGVLEEKRNRQKEIAAGKVPATIEKASVDDAEKLLEVQKLAYRSEAEIYNDFSIAPLTQNLDEIKADFATRTFLKAVIDGQIVGSVRGYVKDGSCLIERLFVHPGFQNQGIGTRLIQEIEAAFPGAQSYELFTGHRSKRNIFLVKKLNYKIARTEKISNRVERVYLQKAGQNRG